VQALVRAVRPGIGVLDAGDEDLGIGKGRRVGGDERDGAADADVHGGPPPRRGQGRVGGPVGRPAGPRGKGRDHPPGSAVTAAPHGARAFRCVTRASRALAASSPGASRRLTLARAAGMSVFEAEATVRASGTGPPYAPLCTPWRRVRTSTVTLAPPRSEVVSDGIPVAQLIESASTSTSARTRPA